MAFGNQFLSPDVPMEREMMKMPSTTNDALLWSAMSFATS